MLVNKDVDFHAGGQNTEHMHGCKHDGETVTVRGGRGSIEHKAKK